MCSSYSQAPPFLKSVHSYGHWYGRLKRFVFIITCMLLTHFSLMQSLPAEILLSICSLISAKSSGITSVSKIIILLNKQYLGFRSPSYIVQHRNQIIMYYFMSWSIMRGIIVTFHKKASILHWMPIPVMSQDSLRR